MTVSFFTVQRGPGDKSDGKVGECSGKNVRNPARQVASLPRTRSPLNDKAKEGTFWQISYKKTTVKSAVRTLANPIADAAAFNTIVQSVITTNPFACTAYQTAQASATSR